MNFEDKCSHLDFYTQMGKLLDELSHIRPVVDSLKMSLGRICLQIKFNEAAHQTNFWLTGFTPVHVILVDVNDAV